MTSPPAAGRRFSGDIQLAGHGLRLSEWTDDDLSAIVDLFDEPQLDRWTPLRRPFNPPGRPGLPRRSGQDKKGRPQAFPAFHRRGV
ncbi:hypothetical protein [Streptomyces sp. SID13031]|uniref:hypothetical protein n=1 Tax=Streptomyces sp. SID13031 TaxID=2706046 RepID=UPI0013C5F62D|nr:hypothetical protein [Streptomyces sp. SID13031]NEA34987.1 hypothetical protein [Streptomyces sp. SID13031]